MLALTLRIGSSSVLHCPVVIAIDVVDKAVVQSLQQLPDRWGWSTRASVKIGVNESMI